MKLIRHGRMYGAYMSPLAMAEWIEILADFEIRTICRVSASDGGVD